MGKIHWPDLWFGPINLWNVWKMQKDYTYQDKMRYFTQPNSTDEVIKDLKDREQMGLNKYGEFVHESSDDMLQHLYEEILDSAVYIKTEINRRKNGL